MLGAGDQVVVSSHQYKGAMIRSRGRGSCEETTVWKAELVITRTVVRNF